MLLKSASPNKPPHAQGRPPQEQIKGIFMPREKRLEAKNEICRAHFNLGSGDVSKC